MVHDDVPNDRIPDDLTWVFAPGSNASKTQLLKYKRAWTGNDDDMMFLSHKCTGDFIGANATSVDFAEIVQRDVHWSTDWKQWPRQVFQALVGLMIWFRHGGTWSQQKQSGTFRVCYSTKSAGPRVMDHHSLDWREFNLGQHKDMRLFGEALQRHRARFPGQPIVLYGVSRGAATIVNFVASAKPDQLEHVVGIVLEGCPDSLPSILMNKVSWMPSLIRDYLVPVAERCWECVTSYSSAGPAPIDNIDKLPKDIPVLFVTSLGDTLISPGSVQRLARKARNQGRGFAHEKGLKPRQNVDIVILPSAPHPGYPLREPDCSQYREAVLSFYNKFCHAREQK